MLRDRLLQMAEANNQIAVNFAAAAGGKLVSTNGFVTEVGEDYMQLKDIYGNFMLVPLVSIAYIEIKK